MKLRVFVPAGERAEADAPWPWMLLDARNALAREGATPPAQMPRAGHDTPISALALPCGSPKRRLSNDQRVPSHRSANASCPLPTAMHAVVDSHDTPLNW